MAETAKIRNAELSFDEGDVSVCHVLLQGKNTETGELVQQTFDVLVATLDDELALLDSAISADPDIEWV